jgi:hypothetical protein
MADNELNNIYKNVIPDGITNNKIVKDFFDMFLGEVNDYYRLSRDKSVEFQESADNTLLQPVLVDNQEKDLWLEAEVESFMSSLYGALQSASTNGHFRSVLETKINEILLIDPSFVQTEKIDDITKFLSDENITVAKNIAQMKGTIKSFDYLFTILKKLEVVNILNGFKPFDFEVKEFDGNALDISPSDRERFATPFGVYNAKMDERYYDAHLVVDGDDFLAFEFIANQFDINNLSLLCVDDYTTPDLSMYNDSILGDGYFINFVNPITTDFVSAINLSSGEDLFIHDGNTSIEINISSSLDNTSSTMVLDTSINTDYTKIQVDDMIYIPDDSFVARVVSNTNGVIGLATSYSGASFIYGSGTTKPSVIHFSKNILRKKASYYDNNSVVLGTRELYVDDTSEFEVGGALKLPGSNESIAPIYYVIDKTSEYISLEPVIEDDSILYTNIPKIKISLDTAYIINTSVHKVVFDYIMKPILHPVGFEALFKQLFNIYITNYFNSNITNTDFSIVIASPQYGVITIDDELSDGGFTETINVRSTQSNYITTFELDLDTTIPLSVNNITHNVGYITLDSDETITFYDNSIDLNIIATLEYLSYQIQSYFYVVSIDRLTTIETDPTFDRYGVFPQPSNASTDFRELNVGEFVVGEDWVDIPSIDGSLINKTPGTLYSLELQGYSENGLGTGITFYDHKDEDNNLATTFINTKKIIVGDKMLIKITDLT